MRIHKCRTFENEFQFEAFNIYPSLTGEYESKIFDMTTYDGDRENAMEDNSDSGGVKMVGEVVHFYEFLCRSGEIFTNPRVVPNMKSTHYEGHIRINCVRCRPDQEVVGEKACPVLLHL